MKKILGTKYLNTAHGYLENSAEITLGGKDFTIAFWLYAPAASTTWQFFFSWGTNTDYTAISRDANNKLLIDALSNGSTVFSPAAADRVAFPTAQWNHIELGYRNSDNTILLFLNGTLVYSNTNATLSTPQNLPIYIGYNPMNSAYYYVGYIDEVLITEKLLHTANFTPPTDPHSADSDTIALLHFE